MKKCLPNYFGNHFAVEGIDNLQLPKVAQPMTATLFPILAFPNLASLLVWNSFFAFARNGIPCFIFDNLQPLLCHLCHGCPAFFCAKMLGPHACRTKLPPKKKKIDTKNGLKNGKKRSENDLKRDRHCFWPLSGRLKIFHLHFSKSFSPPKICKKIKYVFTARL